MNVNILVTEKDLKKDHETELTGKVIMRYARRYEHGRRLLLESFNTLFIFNGTLYVV